MHLAGRSTGVAAGCDRLKLTPHPVRQASEGLCLDLVRQSLTHELHREVFRRGFSEDTLPGVEASPPVTDEKPRDLSRDLLLVTAAAAHAALRVGAGPATIRYSPPPPPLGLVASIA